MMMRARITFLVLAAALAGCGEKPQTTTKKVDAHAWEGARDPFVASGWKAGDRASWEQQMRTRAQGQNEYARAPAAASAKSP
jgi:hypothetical protein